MKVFGNVYKKMRFLPPIIYKVREEAIRDVQKCEEDK